MSEPSKELMSPGAKALLESLEQAQLSNSPQGDFQYMKFAAGDWTFGQDNTETQPGSIWSVNPRLFAGYIAWPSDGLGEPLAKHLGQVGVDPLVTLATLGDPPAGARDGWKPLKGCLLKCLNGEDKDTQVLFQASSGGGIKGINALFAQIVQRLKGGLDCIPQVKLETSSYFNKKYKKDIDEPIFNIVGWDALEAKAPALAAGSGELVAGEIEPAPAQEAEKEPAPEPVRQRRRPV